MPKTYGISWLDNDTVAAWIFFTPALILLGIFIVWPIAYLFYRQPHWVGLKNYWLLLLNPDFGQVIGILPCPDCDLLVIVS